MKLGTALVLATAVHALGFLLLWRTWPDAPIPQGEVVPLELRSAEPPPAPPPPAPVAEPTQGGGGKPGRRAARSQSIVTLQPEEGGEVPVAPASPAQPGAAIGAPGGTGTSSGPATGNGVAAAASVIDHGPLKAEAMERIRRQRHYPELARRRRIEGTVIVAFRIHPDGAVADARVKKGVDEMLDQAALEAVKSAAPLPGALSSDGELEVLLHFGLTP